MAIAEDAGRITELLRQKVAELKKPDMQYYDSPAFTQWKYETGSIIRNHFQPDSPQLREFYSALPRQKPDIRWNVLDSAEEWETKRQETHLYRVPYIKAAINGIISELEEILIQPMEGLPEEVVYPGGKLYDAYKRIKTIVSAASTKLIILDPYVDSSLFDLLQNAQPAVQVKVLTRSMQRDFQLAGKKFKEQRDRAGGGMLTVRTESGDFHDRFIIADDKVFHLGASIKDAGGKLCLISEIQDLRNKEMLMKIISQSWHGASEVL